MNGPADWPDLPLIGPTVAANHRVVRARAALRLLLATDPLLEIHASALTDLIALLAQRDTDPTGVGKAVAVAADRWATDWIEILGLDGEARNWLAFDLLTLCYALIRSARDGRTVTVADEIVDEPATTRGRVPRDGGWAEGIQRGVRGLFLLRRELPLRGVSKPSYRDVARELFPARQVGDRWSGHGTSIADQRRGLADFGGVARREIAAARELLSRA